MTAQQFDLTNPIDITLALDEHTILYPGDQSVALSLAEDISKGDSLNMSEVKSFNIHVGTHVDLPSHFVNNGRSIEDYALNCFAGEAEVFEIMDVPKIEKEHIQRLKPGSADHIILKTRNSELLREDTFNPDYCYLTESAAEELLKFKPKSIGIDYYSLDPSDSHTFESHKVFAEADIPVFVCLNLNDVDAGQYFFSGMPLALTGAEASPVRAVLFRMLND